MANLTKTVAASGDDGFAWFSGGFNNTNTYTMTGSDDTGGGGVEVRSFYRWTGITIPVGSIITATTVTLYNVSNGGPSGNTYLLAGFVDADNQAAPTDKAGMWSWAFATGYLALSNPSTGTVALSSTLYNSVQAIVNRAGWASGNAMVFHMKDNGSSSDRKWVVGTYDGGYYAQLSIDYTPPSSQRVVFFM